MEEEEEVFGLNDHELKHGLMQLSSTKIDDVHAMAGRARVAKYSNPIFSYDVNRQTSMRMRTKGEADYSKLLESLPINVFPPARHDMNMLHKAKISLINLNHGHLLHKRNVRVKKQWHYTKIKEG